MVEPGEILTIREVAAILKVGTKTTYSMAQSGELPGFKVGGQWRFRRGDIDAWIQDRIRKSGRPQDSSGGRDPGGDR